MSSSVWLSLTVKVGFGLGFGNGNGSGSGRAVPVDGWGSPGPGNAMIFSAYLKINPARFSGCCDFGRGKIFRQSETRACRSWIRYFTKGIANRVNVDAFLSRIWRSCGQAVDD